MVMPCRERIQDKKAVERTEVEGKTFVFKQQRRAQVEGYIIYRPEEGTGSDLSSDHVERRAQQRT